MKFTILAAIVCSISVPVWAGGIALAQASPAPVEQVPAIADVAPKNATPQTAPVIYACRFMTGCIDADCSASDYEGRLTVISDGAGLAEAEWADNSETVALSAVVSDDIVLARADDISGAKQRLLTVLPDGGARFTTHASGPLSAITYLGTCKKDG